MLAFSHRTRQSGFTLIEILIAITLLAFITLGVVNITQDAAQTMERTTEINKNNLQIETAMSRFEWDFSQIYSPLYFSTVMNIRQTYDAAMTDNQDGSDTGTPTTGGTNGNTTGATTPPNPLMQAYFEQLATRFERNEHFSSLSKEGQPIPRFYAPEKNVFEFFTSSNRRKIENTKQSHFAWVRYGLSDDNRPPDPDANPNIPKPLKNFVRYFSADDPYGDKRIDIEDIERVKGAVLLENVESLEFQFWDFQRKKWETSLRTIKDGESLIRGVKILITWYDSAGFKRSTERVFRPHWPMVTPTDSTPATTAGSTAGNTTGNTTTGTTGSNGERDEN